MKIQGSGSPVRLPQEVGDATQVRGPQTGAQPHIDQQKPVEQNRQAGLTPESYQDGYEGVKASQGKSLQPQAQLPELDLDKLGELNKEVQHKLQETRGGKRKGGKKGVAEDEEDADGDGIPDVADATPSSAD